MEKLMLSETELKTLLEAVMKGVPLAKAAGLSEDTLEGLYALARQLYASGNFKDAHTLFQALTLYDTRDYRFWMGLGGCRQALERYEEAVDAYQMASLATNLKNPEPLLYATKCLLRLNRKDEAVTALQGLLGVSDAENPDYAAVREKARSLLELLRSGDAS